MNTTLRPTVIVARRFLRTRSRAMVREMEEHIQAEAFETERDEHAQGLAALIERHEATLTQVAHLQADVQERLVPALNRLTAGLQVGDAAAEVTARHERRPKHQGRRRARRREPPGDRPAGGRRDAPGPPVPGEVIINHVHSFHQATKVVQAFARLDGVETVRLRTYTGGVATIDVTIDRPLDALHVAHLDGLVAEVVEATPARLVLRIGRPSYSTLST